MEGSRVRGRGREEERGRAGERERGRQRDGEKETRRDGEKERRKDGGSQEGANASRAVLGPVDGAKPQAAAGEGGGSGVIPQAISDKDVSPIGVRPIRCAPPLRMGFGERPRLLTLLESAAIIESKSLAMIFSPPDTPSGLGRGYFFVRGGA